MALESKPLFHPEVIRQQVRSFTLPERVAEWQPTLQRWADLVTSGRLDDFNETALLPDFLTDIFCGLLGYTGPAESAENYTFSRERHVEVDGKIADAVLGRFRQESETFVAASFSNWPSAMWRTATISTLQAEFRAGKSRLKLMRKSSSNTASRCPSGRELGAKRRGRRKCNTCGSTGSTPSLRRTVNIHSLQRRQNRFVISANIHCTSWATPSAAAAAVMAAGCTPRCESIASGSTN